NTKTFWMTTGMFPQEFIIRFANSTHLNAVTVDSYNGEKPYKKLIQQLFVAVVKALEACFAS
ncbi:hypothetical protein NL108_007880, partial [Boleophthalmus pectinirostris]